MSEGDAAPTLVVIAGPIAVGKSTVARALSDDLRGTGERVALVELDQIAEMALPTLPSWETANTIFASVVGQWLRTPLSCVVAEGPGDPDEMQTLLNSTPREALIVRVVLTSPFAIALERAQADPTRGLSRDGEFLSGVYDSWGLQLPHMRPDVLADTSTSSVAEITSLIRTAIARTRAARRPRVD